MSLNHFTYILINNFKPPESFKSHRDRTVNPKSHTYAPQFHLQQQLAQIRNVIYFPRHIRYLPPTLSTIY
jgi:hypothetical protein